jgi:uncharacterized membrane protein YjjB (DUF3815 family)
MSAAIARTFASGNGGAHFAEFSASKAASIASRLIARRCMVPAKETSLFVLPPSPTANGLAGAVAVGFCGRTVSRSITQPGKSATGADWSMKL